MDFEKVPYPLESGLWSAVDGGGAVVLCIHSHITSHAHPTIEEMEIKCGRDLIPVSIQFEYDPDELATKVTTQLVHKSNSKTCV